MPLELFVTPADRKIPDGWRSFVHLEMPEGHSKADGAPSTVMDMQHPMTMTEREANVRSNIARGLPLLRERSAPHGRTMALACFGPSLLGCWEELATLDADVWSTSGAHPFLVSKGIIPFAHTEVDTRPHKALLVGPEPHPSTHFYIASRCAPEMFDALVGNRVTMYHCGVHEETPFLKSIAPGVTPVPPAITNGLNAVQLGIYLGYRRIVIFGMDGSFTDETHAGWHPNPREIGEMIAEVEGKQFHTSTLHVCALQDFFTIALTSGVEFAFRGEGMIPHAVRESARRWREANP